VTSYLRDTEVANKPIRVFHGIPDDYNPMAPCKAYAARLQAAGADILITEYPEAQHSFDNPLGNPTPVVVANAQTVRNCQIAEETLGVLIDKATRQPFSYKDACVELGPHVNHDASATDAAKSAVKQFLRDLFNIS